MANSNGWGDGAGNNAIGWGQGAVNNSISWGDSHKKSSAGLTDIVGLAYETEYTAVLDRATALGYSLPSESVRTKQNTLLASLKSTGVWAKLDVFYVFAQDGGSAFGTLNWKNPNANQSTLVNSPTFVSNGGLMGNGTSSYIDTNYNPTTQGVQYGLNNASIYFFPHAINAGNFSGAVTTENRMGRGTSFNQRINAGGLTLATAFDYTATINAKSIHRTNSTSIDLYNGSTSENRALNSVNVPNTNLFIMRSTSIYGSHTCAAYAVGAQLTAENTSFINTWNTYKNSL